MLDTTPLAHTSSRLTYPHRPGTYITGVHELESDIENLEEIEEEEDRKKEGRTAAPALPATISEGNGEGEMVALEGDGSAGPPPKPSI